MESAVGVDVTDPRDIVDLLARRQVPSERHRRDACGGAGHQGPRGACKHYLLQRCIDKVEAGVKVVTENYKKTTQESVSKACLPNLTFSQPGFRLTAIIAWLDYNEIIQSCATYLGQRGCTRK